MVFGMENKCLFFSHFKWVLIGVDIVLLEYSLCMENTLSLLPLYWSKEIDGTVELL